MQKFAILTCAYRLIVACVCFILAVQWADIRRATYLCLAIDCTKRGTNLECEHISPKNFDQSITLRLRVRVQLKYLG